MMKLRLLVLFVFFLGSEKSVFSSFGVDYPTGSIQSSLQLYVDNPSHANSSRITRTEVYHTPIEGRPWRVLELNEYENTRNNRKVTGHSLRVLPSKENVERIELEVWADSDEGFVGFGIRRPSTWIGMSAHFMLAPFGGSLAAQQEKSNETEKGRRAVMQVEELTPLLQEADERQRTKRRESLEEIDRVIEEFRGHRLNHQEAQAAIEIGNKIFLDEIEKSKIDLFAFKDRWQIINEGFLNMLEQMGISPLDPATQAIIEPRLNHLDRLKTDFYQETKLVVKTLLGTEVLEENLPSVRPLYGIFGWMGEDDPSVGDIFQFLDIEYRRVPDMSSIPATNRLQIVSDRQKWEQLFFGRREIQ